MFRIVIMDSNSGVVPPTEITEINDNKNVNSKMPIKNRFKAYAPRQN